MTNQMQKSTQWFLATVVSPEGIFHKKLVLGYGTTPDEMLAWAHEAALLCAGEMADTAHQPADTYQILSVEPCDPPY